MYNGQSYIHNNGDNEDNEDEESSWDEVSIETKPISNEVVNNIPNVPNAQDTSPIIQSKKVDNNNYEDRMTILNDRQLFNTVNNTNMHDAKGLWKKNKDSSELLNNNVSNELEQQYASYWNQVKNEHITPQSYDNIINLRDQESKTYFNSDTSSDIHSSTTVNVHDINAQRLSSIGNNIQPPQHDIQNNSSDIVHDRINSNNTLDYKSLNNDTMFNKGNVLDKQYGVLESHPDVDSFLKTNPPNIETSGDDIQRETIELSDVRNTYALNQNNSIINTNHEIEAFETFSNFSNI